ncbi:hypothetical protein Tco_0766954, partial [Tanacetum coccineum]
MGFLSENGRDLRPADLLLFNWIQGKYVCLDVTGISPFAGMGANSWAPGVAFHNAVEKKMRKYATKCADNGYKFIPFAFLTFGEFDKDALDTLSRISQVLKGSDGASGGARGCSATPNNGRITLHLSEKKKEKKQFDKESDALMDVL